MRLFAAVIASVAIIAAAPIDWTRTVTNAGGAYVIGNPRAKVRVVEYTSYTCPHCAAFAREGQPKLMRAVARGTVAFEIRTAVRDRLDFAAAVAARCVGPARFAAAHDAIFAAQTALTERTVAWQDGAGRGAPTEANAALKALARGSGLTQLMAARGLAPAALDACLTSKAAQAPVLAMTNDAWNVRKISGTPAFFVNGEAVEGNSFEAIDPHIQARLGAVRQGR